MKKCKILLFCLLAMGLLLVASVSAAAETPSVNFTPTLVTNTGSNEDVLAIYAKGDTVELHLEMQATAMPACKLQLVYDTSLLQMTKFVVNESLRTTNKNQLSILSSLEGNDAGMELHIALNGDTFTGEGLFATITFTALKTAGNTTNPIKVSAIEPAALSVSSDTVQYKINHETHSYGEWQTIVAPTETTSGEAVHYCTFCSKAENKTLDPVKFTLTLTTGAKEIRRSDDNILYAIKPGCTKSELFTKFSVADRSVTLLTADGKAVNDSDILKTGMYLRVADGTGKESGTVPIAVFGDSDGDGKVTASDARSILRTSVSLEKPGRCAILAMDCDADGVVSASDARFALRVSVNLDAFYEISATGITLSKSSLALLSGQSQELTATIQPSNTTLPTILWSSSDESIATVSLGKVTAHKGGTATITAATRSGKKATCTVTVTQSADSITFARSTVYLPEATGTVMLHWKIAPESYTAPLTWSSSNANFTVIDGNVTCRKSFEELGSNTSTLITVKASNGVKGTVRVEMVPASKTYCAIPSASGTVAAGKTMKLNHIMYGSGTLSWAFDNQNILSFDSTEGIFTALKPGTVTIYCAGVDVTDTFVLTITGTLSAAEQLCRDYLQVAYLLPYGITAEGNVQLAFKFRNTTSKTIDTIAIQVTPYDAAGNACVSATDGSSEKTCYIYEDLAPSKAADYYVYGFPNVWKNSNIVSVRLSRVDITYTDSTTAAFTGDQLAYIFW